MEAFVKKELIAATVRVKKLSRLEIERMYELFSEYYQNHTRESFEHDLLEKNHVILLRDSQTSVLQGFSTLLRVTLLKSGKKIIGVYSGDTVIGREYWGSGALGIEFLKYLWKLNLRSAGTPVYWFLISKGYKTYLLMAKNFVTHYPRIESETPTEYRQLMDEFYGKKFGSNYDPASGVIRFNGVACALKDQVADITPELLKEPRIDFFQRRNPGWMKGDELACVARMTFWMPFKYALKKALKVRTR
jgi:hypothetical protein